MNTRIYVEKKEQFQVEANSLLAQLKQNLKINATNLRLVNIYDVYNVDKTLLEEAKKSIFSEVVTDDILDDINLTDKMYFAVEYLPGQFDQRAQSAMECMQLLDPKTNCTIRSGHLIILQNTTQEELQKVMDYYINPIEARIKDLSKLSLDLNVNIVPLKVYDNFIEKNEEQLKAFVKTENLAMTLEDLLLIQEYFKSQNTNPTEVEIKLLDTYWSDHCRHTTFNTFLTQVTFEHSALNNRVNEVYERYLQMNDNNKPLTFMNMATINARYLKNKGLLDEVEESEEINACSVFVDVDVDDKLEKYLVMFKNETHNHPTEVEPFGGASTCIGGAIRDPLSGRSYVYQAMRISGCANVFEKIEDTLPNKLAQSTIAQKAALGYSSYGNQIGLATSYVKEYYHDSYVAKHLELGAVVGAVKADLVRRQAPIAGDVIILLGGKTGRDGIGGATGSSKELNQDSLVSSAAEVQKGNAPEERKIQRFFRNPEVIKLIKKCNDFGAGGVSVAIGELASGLEIDLSKVKVKYEGLNAVELAISESQERMAVVVCPKDVNVFINLAKDENLEAYEVAKVIEAEELVMKYNDKVVANLKRTFLDSGGAKQYNDVIITDSLGKNPFYSINLTEENILKTLQDKNVACQKGLVEMFDSSIGSTTVLNPFGGKTLMTPTQVSIQKIPGVNTKTATILASGFNPEIFEYSPFLGSQYAVLEVLAKVVAVGGNFNKVYFSLQEYFPKLNNDPKKWGEVFKAMLGSIKVFDYFNLAAIGGKDSMSGSYLDIDVVSTLVAFGCSVTTTNNVISSELKTTGNHLVVFIPTIDDLNEPDLNSYLSIFKTVTNEIKNQNIISSYVVEKGGILTSCFKMSFGNQKGFKINTNINLLKLIPGAIVVECKSLITNTYAYGIGRVTDNDYIINDLTLTQKKILDTWLKPFSELYPIYSKNIEEKLPIIDYTTKKIFKPKSIVNDVKVLIPVFPGTNCEYDIKQAFEKEGATTNIFVFKNYDKEVINQSIKQLATLINQANILAIPGGFSGGDEPDGSGKFIVNVLQNSLIKEAVQNLLDNDGLILGICNGFQALIKSGLLPYGQIRKLGANDATLFRNDINKHIATIATTRLTSNNSPWLQDLEVGSVHKIPISHGEGKFVVEDTILKELIENGQIAFQYCTLNGMPSMNSKVNLNASTYAIEGIVSKCGKILGKMGHSERYQEDIFKNIEGNRCQNIFRNALNYFRGSN